MEKKYFSRHRSSSVELPNLPEVQLNSYKWFFDSGLHELFDEVSPIRDFSSKDLMLDFASFSLDEPKYDEAKTRELNLSYEAPLRMRSRLTNKKTGEVKNRRFIWENFLL